VTGKFLFAANYSSGNVLVYPLAADGRIQEPTANVQHSGSGPNKERQEGPHAHMVLPTPDNQYLLVTDLGADLIVVYRFDGENGKLERVGAGTVEPGAGPRHMALHGNGRILFVLNELHSTLTSFQFAAGQLTALQSLSTLPAEFSGESTCAAIRLGENGRFVYASNRGHDSIATFAFDEASEWLTLVDHTATQGQTPRDFILLDDLLLAGNQDSDTVTHYQIDAATGVPQPTGQISHIPTPVCFVY
jgi:6-phosphogluconolactonase